MAVSGQGATGTPPFDQAGRKQVGGTRPVRSLVSNPGSA